MTVRDIFTIIDIYNDKMNASAAALEFASRRKAHVTGLALALEPIAPGFLASPVPAEYLVEAITNAENSAKEAATAFTAEAGRLGVDAEACPLLPTLATGEPRSDLIRSHHGDDPGCRDAEASRRLGDVRGVRMRRRGSDGGRNLRQNSGRFGRGEGQAGKKKEER